MSKAHERCIVCDEHTGKAGKGDDSAYYNGQGPYCDTCFQDVWDATLTPEQTTDSKEVAR